MKKDDVLIVGAGLGGLSSGAMLAKRGHKVTIIDQHYAAGGCATIFHRKGFKFEVGLHAMDGMDDVDPKMFLFDDVGLTENIPWVHIPRTEFFRYRHPDLDLVVPCTIEGATEALGARFPKEKKRLVEFFHTVTTIRRTLNRVFMLEGLRQTAAVASFPFAHWDTFTHRNTTIADYLDAMFDDELLKLALIGNVLYYHDDPRKLGLFWYCLSQISYMSGGVHFVRGGSQVLSNYLADYVTQRGGEVILNHDVDEILTDGRHARGVRYHRSKGSRQEVMLEREAKIVIANAPVPVVVNDLVKSPAIAKLRDKVNGMKKSCSFSSLYLGFKRPLSELGNRSYSTVIPGADIHRLDDLNREYRDTDWTRKGFEVIDYSQIDSGLAPAGKSVAVISFVDYIWNWDKLSEAEYRAQKEHVSRIMIEKLDHYIPGAKDAIELYELATPKTIVRFTRNPEGGIYGFHQDPSQAAMNRLRNQTPIDNMYFASAWAMPGGGFTGAMLSGMRTAQLVHQALGKGRG